MAAPSPAAPQGRERDLGTGTAPGDLQHVCPLGHSHQHGPTMGTAIGAPPVPLNHLLAQVRMSHIGGATTQPLHPALFPGGSSPPLAGGTGGLGTVGTADGANRGGEALAAGSEPGEAANASPAKSGSFSSSAAGEGPGHGAGDGRCPHGTPRHPPRCQGTPVRGGQRDTGTVGVPGQSPTRQDTPRLSTGTKGTTLRDKRSLPTPQTPQSRNPNLGQFPTCFHPQTPTRGTERPPRVPSPPGHPVGQSRPLGSAHLEAAAVPVVPGTFGLLLLLCSRKMGGQSLVGSRGSPQPVEQLPSLAAPPSTGLWSHPHRATPAAQPARSRDQLDVTSAVSSGHPGAGDTYPGAAGTSVPPGPGCAAPPDVGAVCWGRRRCRDIPRPPCTARSAASRCRPWPCLPRQRGQLGWGDTQPGPCPAEDSGGTHTAIGRAG